MIDCDLNYTYKQLEALKNKYSGLGTIAVEVYRLRSIEDSEKPKSTPSYSAAHHRQPATIAEEKRSNVPERAIKGAFLSHLTV